MATTVWSGGTSKGSQEPSKQMKTFIVRTSVLRPFGSSVVLRLYRRVCAWWVSLEAKSLQGGGQELGGAGSTKDEAFKSKLFNSCFQKALFLWLIGQKLMTLIFWLGDRDFIHLGFERFSLVDGSFFSPHWHRILQIMCNSKISKSKKLS